MTPEEFMDKMDWEGGAEALVDYGLAHSDVPIEILPEYVALEKAVQDFHKKLDALGWV